MGATEMFESRTATGEGIAAYVPTSGRVYERKLQGSVSTMSTSKLKQ